MFEPDWIGKAPEEPKQELDWSDYYHDRDSDK